MNIFHYIAVHIFVLCISSSVEGVPELDEKCPEKAFDVSCDEDEFTTLDTEAAQGEGTPEGLRLKRSVEVEKPPLEQHFEFTDDKDLFYDLLDGTPPHDKKLFHQMMNRNPPKDPPDPNRKEGYAESNRTRLLLYDVSASWYPPWTYHGLYDVPSWHDIPTKTLLKKRNRSFMMLEHHCEQLDSREQESACARAEYSKLPSCHTEDQSPINIMTKKARDSSLKEFDFTNIMSDGEPSTPVKFPFMMSLPWDGTNVLTVELLEDATTHKPAAPGVEKGSISGKKLFLERIHIHYGRNMTVGSEHMLDNQKYSMELQFIFTMRENVDGIRTRNDLQYYDLLMKYYTKDGVADRHKNVHIISLLVNAAEKAKFTNDEKWNDEWNKNAVEAFKPLSYAARKFWAIHNPLQTSEPPGEPFKYRAVKSKGPEGYLELGAFFPPKVFDKSLKPPQWRESIYYNYKGGLTHPPCFSYIEWDVYDRPLVIPDDLWQNFLYIHSEFDESKYVAGNFRSPSDTYILAMDRKKKREWTSLDDKKREELLKRISNRDIRKSKPSGTSSDNYDYEDPKKDCSCGKWINEFLLPFLFTVLRIL